MMSFQISVLLLTFFISTFASENSICQNPDAAHARYAWKENKPKEDMPNQRERTFIMVKPDGVERGLVGEIIKRFEGKGLKLVGIKSLWASKVLLEELYSEHFGKNFFAKLVDYVSSGPVVPMVWEGSNAVQVGRTLMGATNPKDSPPGTIRGDFALEMGRNVVHGSDSVEAAKREINLWFDVKELVSWDRSDEKWIYE